MNSKKISSRKILAGVVGLVTLEIINAGAVLSTPLFYSDDLPFLAQAQPTWIQRFRRIFTGPQRIGSGTNNQPAHVQDRCPFIPEGAPGLTALVPTGATKEMYIEKTVSSRPVFLFYVPYTAQQYRDAEFVLIDEQEEDVYRLQFPLTNEQPSILSLELPTTVSLRPGQRYQWVFSIICNPANRSSDATLHSWVERESLAPELAQQLEQIDSNQPQADQALARAAIYADAELWFETVRTLADAHQRDPHSILLQTAWSDLLESVHLSNLQGMPVVPCCPPAESVTSASSTATPPEE